MRHPFRRFSYMMAEKLHMTLPEIQNKISSYEMTEWMAYHLTQNEDWIKKFKYKEELEKSRQLSQEELAAQFKKMLRGKEQRKT